MRCREMVVGPLFAALAIQWVSTCSRPEIVIDPGGGARPSEAGGSNLTGGSGGLINLGDSQPGGN